MERTDRLPPFSAELETALLGCAVTYAGEVMPMLAMAGISEDTFYVPAHRNLFMLLRDMAARTCAIDIITVQRAAHEQGLLEIIGGETSIERVCSAGFILAHAGYYIAQLVELYSKRRLINAAREAVQSAYDNAEKTAATLAAELNSALA